MFAALKELTKSIGRFFLNGFRQTYDYHKELRPSSGVGSSSNRLRDIPSGHILKDTLDPALSHSATAVHLAITRWRAGLFSVNRNAEIDSRDVRSFLGNYRRRVTASVNIATSRLATRFLLIASCVIYSN